jgi:hypothetical protein
MTRVYFESENGSACSLEATFLNEETYNCCIKPLEQKAKELGMILTESVEII